MILSLSVTKEQKKALLLRYSSVKFFLQKAISKKANEILENNPLDVDSEGYHKRQALNAGIEHEENQPWWKNRKHSQATKDKIRKTLKEKYQGTEHHLFEETKIKIGLANKGKIVSQATRNKISKANSGKKRTDAQRERIGEGHKGLHYNKEKSF